MPRYKNVSFELLGAGDSEAVHRALRGTVIVRDGEMVLEVELPGDRPYLIKGKECDGFYAGAHDGHKDDVPVYARWTRLDNIWIGMWVEEGYDYLFSFELPSTK